MKVVVMGAGVIGETTAFLLAKDGHEVIVIDREPAIAEECSFANGGQLSYSHVAPWATPSILKKIPEWLLKKDSPLVVSPRVDWRMWQWMWRFAGRCSEAKMQQASCDVLRLSLYSREVIHDIIKNKGIDFCHLKTGTLHVFSEQKALDENIKQAAFLAQFGCPYEVLTPAQCIEKEPALQNSPYALVGGVWFPLDESGDVHEFTVKLAEVAETRGWSITFRDRTTIQQLLTDGRNITGVQTDKGRITADAYVMALGAYSPLFLRQVGVHVPIYPLKGYSLSVPLNEKSVAPITSITDQGNKIVYSRLCDVLRVAGTAELCGYNHEIRSDRIGSLKRMTQQLFPWLDKELEAATPWACLRPSTPEGSPYLGKTPLENLYLNTGHGTLGWTLAAGSARIVADLVEGKEPDIDMSGLGLRL